jgi:hypothetical protein
MGTHEQERARFGRSKYLLGRQSVVGEDILNAIQEELLLPIAPYPFFIFYFFAGSFFHLLGLACRSPRLPLAVIETFVEELELHEQCLMSGVHPLASLR